MYQIIVKRGERVLIDETYTDYELALGHLDVLEETFPRPKYSVDFRALNYFRRESK